MAGGRTGGKISLQFMAPAAGAVSLDLFPGVQRQRDVFQQAGVFLVSLVPGSFAESQHFRPPQQPLQFLRS